MGIFLGETVGLCRRGATNEGSADTVGVESCSFCAGSFISILLGAGLAGGAVLTGDLAEIAFLGAICPFFWEGCFDLLEDFSVCTFVSWLVLVTGGSLRARREPTAKARISNYNEKRG